MPLAKTQADLWRLVYDHQLNAIVMLNEMDESNEVCVYHFTKSNISLSQSSGFHESLKYIFFILNSTSFIAGAISFFIFEIIKI